MPGDKGEGQGNKEEGLTKRHKEIFKSEEYVYIYIYIYLSKLIKLYPSNIRSILQVNSTQ